MDWMRAAFGFCGFCGWSAIAGSVSRKNKGCAYRILTAEKLPYTWAMEPNTMPPQGSVPPKPSSSGSKGTAYTVGLVVGGVIVVYLIYAYFAGAWPFA